jgi:hypothetical protein
MKNIKSYYKNNTFDVTELAHLSGLTVHRCRALFCSDRDWRLDEWFTFIALFDCPDAMVHLLRKKKTKLARYHDSVKFKKAEEERRRV